jgi:hypothetical protein
MRHAIAHALRRIARWSIAASNHLLPPAESIVTGCVGGVHQTQPAPLGGVRCQCGLLTAFGGTAPLSVTYTGGPEGPAARKVRLREEC